MPSIDFSSPWSIACASEHPTALLAVSELQGALERLTGSQFPAGAVPGAAGPVLSLGHQSLDSDSFTWSARPERIDLYGDSPRGLLYAVYSLLEALGFRWIAPGPSGERFAPGTSFNLPTGRQVECPALPGRCLILGHQAFLKDVEDWTVWAARNRLNTLFIHVIDEPLTLGAAPLSRWRAMRAKALPLARERGMTIELGGHGLAALLPRRLFRQMPEAFRFHAGKRRPDHNFCPSSPAALQVIRENAAAYFRAYPEADVYHLWPDDIVGGGWCECASCRGYSASEQALLATNAVAEALETVHPGAQIAFLAYHDTEAVPARVQPRRNVCVLWAPRMRCYAHPVTDPSCLVNTPRYTGTFSAQVDHFRQAAARPARVFEYYLDAVLFKSVLPPLSRVLQADLAFYQQAGAHTVQALMTGDAPWPAAQLNAWLFARLAWNPAQDPAALVGEYCAAAFGACSDELSAYYAALEQAFALALTTLPRGNIAPRGGRPGQPAPESAHGYGRPGLCAPACAGSPLPGFRTDPGLLAEAEWHLEAARESANPQAWQAEQVSFSLARGWLEFDHARVNLYRAVGAKAPSVEVRRWLAAAEAALERVYAWGEANLTDPRFRLNFRFTHLVSWQMRLSWIRSRVSGLPGLNRLVYVRTLFDLWRLSRKLRYIYE